MHALCREFYFSVRTQMKKEEKEEFTMLFGL